MLWGFAFPAASLGKKQRGDAASGHRLGGTTALLPGNSNLNQSKQELSWPLPVVLNWLGGAGAGAVTVTKRPAGPLLCHTPDNSTSRNFPYLQNRWVEVMAKYSAARLRAPRVMAQALCPCLVRLQKFQLLKSAGARALLDGRSAFAGT